MSRLENDCDSKSNGILKLVYLGLLREERLPVAVLELLATIPECQLNVYGKQTCWEADRAYESRFRSVIDRANYLGFHGEFDPRQSVHLLRKSHALLMAFNPRNTNLDLCMPNKLFQAMQAGIPIIASQISCVSRLVQEYECGWVFEYESLNTMRDALCDAQDPTSFRRKSQGMSQLRQVYQRDYDLNRTLLALYQRLSLQNGKAVAG